MRQKKRLQNIRLDKEIAAIAAELNEELDPEELRIIRQKNEEIYSAHLPQIYDRLSREVLVQLLMTFKHSELMSKKHYDDDWMSDIKKYADLPEMPNGLIMMNLQQIKRDMKIIRYILNLISRIYKSYSNNKKHGSQPYFFLIYIFYSCRHPVFVYIIIS